MRLLNLTTALAGLTLSVTAESRVQRPASALIDERCRPTSIGNADSLIKHSIEAVGLDRTTGKVRVATNTDVISMKFQSDRMYPPYLRRTVTLTTNVDWEKGALRTEQTAGQTTVANVTDGVRRVMYTPRGAQLLEVRQGNFADDRAIDPWTVLADWRNASGLRVSGECYYRDYWRTVVSRGSGPTEEKLYLDKKTGIPIKLDRRDRDNLWGDVHAEYLWSIWTPAGDAVAPQFAFRIVDGELDYERITQNYKVIPRDSAAGKFDIAADAAPIRPQTAAPPPDTVRVSANTFVLVTPSYTNVVTLQRDTVFVLDAQTSAARAQQDSVWIGKLFPGKHPIVLVVTDLAWPHIAGVRYWVALGTPVISHRASKEFLQQVVDHRWTVEPDLLEKRRASARLTFKAVDDKLDLGGGAVRLRAIDGVGSEGAVMAYVPSDRFLYAGDYIQPGGPGSFSAVYAREVRAAVQRAGFTPDRFVAMHMKLSQWLDIERIAQRGDN
jgi:glyoxylase-like metal-dependent hydrolase (beta-lactamase superfamily II)